MRSVRRKDLVGILRAGQASSQSEIVAALNDLGHRVTQATVSRDLQEIGATKVRISGKVAYRMPDDIPLGVGGDVLRRNLEHNLQEFAVDVKQAGSLAIVTTAPGHASAVARAIDLAALDEVIGTVAGDDTIFVATTDDKTAADLVHRWRGAAADERGAI